MKFDVKLKNFERNVDNKIAAETEARKDEQHRIDGKFDEVLKRLEKLEVSTAESSRELQDKKNAERKQDDDSGGWRPAHIVLGGWPERCPRYQVSAHAKAWMDKHPEFKGKSQEPFCPRKYGSIAKSRARAGVLRQVAWEMQETLQGEELSSPSTWACLGRSPEQRATRRQIRDAVAAAKLVIDGAGVIYTSGRERARFEVATKVEQGADVAERRRRLGYLLPAGVTSTTKEPGHSAGWLRRPTTYLHRHAELELLQDTNHWRHQEHPHPPAAPTSTRGMGAEGLRVDDGARLHCLPLEDVGEGERRRSRPIRMNSAEKWSMKITECERHDVGVNDTNHENNFNLHITSIHIPPGTAGSTTRNGR